MTVNDYLDKLVEYCIMKLYCIATVKETRQTWADEDDFQVLKPNIDVKARQWETSEILYFVTFTSIILSESIISHDFI